MGRDRSLDSSKRRRNGADEDLVAEPTPLKKRRLQDSVAHSPSTPRALNAIASAISGAFGFGRRTNSAPTKTIDSIYDVPDFDTDEPSVTPNQATRAKSRSGSKVSGAKDVVYDIPHSENEDEATPTAKRGRRSGSARSARNSNSAVQSKGATESPSKRTTPRGRKEASGQPGNEDGDQEETPSKVRSSTRRRVMTAKALGSNGVINGTSVLRKASPETDEPLPSIKKTRKPLQEIHADKSPALKGILTPSRKDTPRRQKSVTFSAQRNSSNTEVFFEDLPTKSIKKKGAAKGRAKLSVEVEEAETEADDVEVAKEDGGDEEAEEDDEVCAICSKPDSEPPNEIIFCDGCDLAVHQDCYDVPDIPEDEWLCRECTRKESAKHDAAISDTLAADEAQEIPNFENHLRSLQRVLLDRCTGRRKIKLIEQEEVYGKTHQLVQQTVLAGEGNSMLVIGSRGCGKTTVSLRMSRIPTIIGVHSTNSLCHSSLRVLSRICPGSIAMTFMLLD
jgi:origin recognition complex subunit 4